MAAAEATRIVISDRFRQIAPLVARIAVAIVIGVLFGVLEYHYLAPDRAVTYGRDFTIPWLAARGILRGVDAYDFVRMTPAVVYGHLLFYPLMAGVVAIPFASFRADVAAALFVGVSFGWLAFALTRDAQWWRLVMLTSATAFWAAGAAQWSPALIAASLAIPTVGLLCVKPTLAIPLLAAQRARRAIGSAVIGGGLLIALCFVLQPQWLSSWYHTTHNEPLMAQYQVPVLTRFGWPLALAALKWRRSEARLLLGLACVPQTFFLYDQLPLMLTAKTRAQALALSCLSWLVFFARPLVSVGVISIDRISLHRAPLLIVGLFWPALVLVLRRPNAAE